MRVSLALGFGTLLITMVQLAKAVSYVDTITQLCKGYDGSVKDGKKPTGKREVTMNGARYEGNEPKWDGLVTLKTDCGQSKLTSCAIKDSDGKTVSIDAVSRPVYAGIGCTAELQLKAEDGSLKKCRLGCPSWEQPIVTCEGFVEETVCASATKSALANIKTAAVSVGKASIGRASADVADKQIEYRANCKKKEILRCAITDDSANEEVFEADATYNPQPESSGCSKKFGMKVGDKTPMCRMCCSKYAKATIICDA